MNKQEWNEGLNHLDPAHVEKYLDQKEKLAQKKKTKSIWLRIGAIAACFVIVGAMFMRGSVPVWDSAQYSAADIAALFDFHALGSVSTNAYTKVYVPDTKYLYIDEAWNKEYLNVYQYNREEMGLNEEEFEGFINGILPKVVASVNGKLPQYEIEIWGDDLTVSEKVGDYRIGFQQTETYSQFFLYSGSDDRIVILDGEPILIDQRLSDEEIIQSLQSIKNKLFDIFGVSFTDTKVLRIFDDYSEFGSDIHVVLYNENAHPLNATQRLPISDYILISFYNPSIRPGDPVSNTVLKEATVQYIKNRRNVSEEYTLIAKAKRISLTEAEELLYKGYVFGGHSCSLCMANQNKISFEGYDFVEIEYVFGRKNETNRSWPTDGIPFYAFYKKIGTAKNGNSIYAKTYVPAIEVSGYDEYFESQISKHNKR